MQKARALGMRSARKLVKLPMRLRPFLPALVVLAAASVPVSAHADHNLLAAPQTEMRVIDPAADPAVARLLDAKTTLKWNYSSRDGRYGHAEALVDAPVDKVAATALEFNRYRELHRKFATARVIGKDAQGTDVYMRYPVQIGPMKIEFWEVMRFGLPRTEGATRIIEARGIKGDMKQGHTLITVKPVGPRHSLLTVDVMLVPKIPAPQSMIDEELRDGANDFVNGLRARAQGWNGAVTTL